ncbi:MAG: NAD-dependent epimerase/dehydratase family protein [Candidatus Eremiobacterota bacterium]
MKALVTGGGGFLGGAIVAQLMEQGHQVTTFSRGRYPRVEALGARCLQGDLSDPPAVSQAVAGCDVVFHVAARAGIWGSFEEYFDANVRGTLNVLDACRAHRISRLVYTSSPSVTFGGEESLGSDERLPYPRRFLNHYSRTKAMAERMVLGANGHDGLSTVSLRPHIIWGPHDNHILPRLIARAREGKLLQVGNGTNRVDITYVDNAARAHLQAAERLSPESPVAGRAYFLSQGEPVALWPWINDLLIRLGIAPVRRKIPFRAAYALGAVLEFAHGVIGLGKGGLRPPPSNPRLGEPRMTRFVACQLGMSHFYNIEAAHRDLGYQARVSTAEGLERTVAWLQQAPPVPTHA